MSLRTTITKRPQRRKQRDGSVKLYDRYVLNYADPKTGKRQQRFFEKQKDAYDAQRKLLLDYENGITYDKRQVPTLAQVFDRWLEDRNGQVKKTTYKGYADFRKYIVGPLLSGSMENRHEYTSTGKLPKGCVLIPMLGNIKLNELATADIRTWHGRLADLVGAYTANRSVQRLKTMLDLAAEDYNIRPPAMPRRLGRGRHKEKKTILMPEQVKRLMDIARQDTKCGLYVAFPFLTGVRPSEMLALHWSDVDFDKGVIRIHRMLEKDGSITDFTKTEAGTREIPLWSFLREWLMEWRIRCPRKDGELWLVFPSQGAKGAWPQKKVGGGVLLYSNFRQRVWLPFFKRMAEEGLPYVTPHSARHCFISTLQAQGVEVGLVAKLAGHSDPAVTLGHYTQAVRGGAEAIERLAGVYC